MPGEHAGLGREGNPVESTDRPPKRSPPRTDQAVGDWRARHDSDGLQSRGGRKLPDTARGIGGLVKSPCWM